MHDDDVALAALAREYLDELCIPGGRPPGSPSNRSATADLARRFAALGLRTETPEFDCLVWNTQGAELTVGGERFAAEASPFGLGGEGAGRLAVCSSLAELEGAELAGSIVLLRGAIAREQLAPKNYPFYNVEEHQRIISALEEGRPLAVVGAGERNPQSVGAVYPYPLIEDGDFAIPAAHMTSEEGLRLAQFAGQQGDLAIRSQRSPGRACNVVARTGPAEGRRLVVCAHIDSRGGTPGALDNGTGVAVLLLLGELLRGYRVPLVLELLAVNGEDYYGASGELDYLARNQGAMGEIALAANLDAAGWREGRTAWSAYGLPDDLAASVRRAFAPWPELMEGEPWYQSDHMVFAQNQVPALAITSERFLEVQARFAHSPDDMPALVDGAKLVATARALRQLVDELAS